MPEALRDDNVLQLRYIWKKLHAEAEAEDRKRNDGLSEQCLASPIKKAKCKGGTTTIALPLTSNQSNYVLTDISSKYGSVSQQHTIVRHLEAIYKKGLYKLIYPEG